jgi:phthalate 4,5-cis-dihydrodiol dehydrogenase
MSKLKIGIVGIGAQMLENLLPTLLQMPDIRIVAACDGEPDRGKQIHRFICDEPIVDRY